MSNVAGFDVAELTEAVILRAVLGGEHAPDRHRFVDLDSLPGVALEALGDVAADQQGDRHPLVERCEMKTTEEFSG